MTIDYSPSHFTPRAPEAPPGAKLALSGFILGFFIFEYHPGAQDVAIPFHYIEWLLLGIAMISSGQTVLGQAPRLLAVGLGIVFIGTPALLFYSDQPGQGPAFPYYVGAFVQGIYIFTAAVLAFAFYREALFLRIWMRIAYGAAAIAILGFFLAQAGVTPILAQYSENGSGLRLTGLLSEASAWAPVIPGLVFLAFRRRSLPLIILSLTALALTRSPTVLLTTLLSAGVILLLRPGRLILKAIAVGGSTWALIEIWPKLQDPATSSSLMASGNPAKVSLGRLIGGFQYIETAGSSGQNVRYDGVQGTVTATLEGGWEVAGRGLGSSQVYFPAVFNEQKAFSYLSQIFFDFGAIGLVLFLILAIRTMWQIRGLEASYVFVPFFIASAINSAQGGASTKFIWLAIFAYVFGVVADQNRIARSPGAAQSRSSTPAPSSP